MSVQILKDFLFDLDFALNSLNIRYAVARNGKTLPHSISGNDIDLLVDDFRYDDLIVVLRERFAAKIFRIVQKPSVVNVFFINVKNGNSIFLQVDFIFSVHFRGACLMKSEHVLDYRIRRNNLWMISDIDASAVIFIAKGIAHLAIPEKYKLRFHRLQDAEVLARINLFLAPAMLSDLEYNAALNDDKTVLKSIRDKHLRNAWLCETKSSIVRLLDFALAELRATLPGAGRRIIVVPDSLLHSSSVHGSLRGSATELKIFECRTKLELYFRYYRPSRIIGALVVPFSLAKKQRLRNVAKVQFLGKTAVRVDLEH